MSRLLQPSNLISFFVPLVYSLLLGYAWALVFKKKYLNSIAPAYMTHIILVLLSGLIFKRLSLGIIGGIIIAIFALIFCLAKETKKEKSFIKNRLADFQEDGLIIFLIFYVFVFFANFGKRFTEWDEFSHWGMFLKESLRLDGLYCMSPLEFAHKDYVPALTLFETIWCKISGGFSEVNAYRAIQMLMFSWIMPMCRIKTSTTDKNFNRLVKKSLMQLLAVIFSYSVLLIFYQYGNNLFHSIYVDLPLGILLAWCIFEIYREQDNNYYMIISLTIGMVILVLSKMIAMAFVPPVLLYLGARLLYSRDKTELASKEKKSLKNSYIINTTNKLIIVAMTPSLIWLWFNLFVRKWSPDAVDSQSYSGMMRASILDPFKAPWKSGISYISELRSNYIYSLFHNNLLFNGGSYFVILLLLVIILAIFSAVCNKMYAKKIIFLNIWSGIGGIFYAVLMYYLYATVFPEYEALNLASYERYMNSYLITVSLLIIGAYFEYATMEGWKEEKHIRRFMMVSLGLISYLLIFHINLFDPVFTGYFTKDKDIVSNESQYADIIFQTTTDGDKIYIITRGDNGFFITKQRYYCDPKIIGGGSIGPAVNQGDIWSIDYSVDDFAHELVKWDYIWFYNVDEAFIDKYEEIFSEEYPVENGNIYKISEVLK